MQILENYSLRELNTFGFEASARYFAEAHCSADVVEALRFVRALDLSLLVLGEGSNVVLVSDLPGLVLKLANSGIEVVGDAGNSVTIRVGAGQNWHELVRWCLDQGYFGIENLSLIPGSVGAAPVQNIGAYGVELKDVFHSLEAVDRETLEVVTLNGDDCQFAYRDSLFKGEARGRYIICHVNLTLSMLPEVNTRYGAIAVEIERLGLVLTPQSVSAAVCQLRSSKLPDPAEIGNAGSFFKNPVIEDAQRAELQQQFPDLVAYSDVPGYSKLAAGWLIEQCGWKGVREADIGVHAKQALVLVNYGVGQAEDLLALAERIKESVQQRFAVTLEMEPTIYPVSPVYPTP